MQKKPRLVLDRFCEVFDLLEKYIDEDFYDFGQVEPVPGSVYLVGRQNFLDNADKFRDMAKSGLYVMIFGNNAEGSWTLETQLKQLRIDELAREKKVLVLGGAEIDPQYPCLELDHFLIRILDFPENVEARSSIDDIFDKKHKPYKFLFLNGRARPHRKYLYEKFRRNGVLDHSLYTMLDAKPTVVRHFEFREDGVNVMATPSLLTRLPDHYEVERYRNPVFGPIVLDRTYLKQELFRREWGEIYLQPEPYIDTYFSLITETVCAESDFSFRTEKIAKPIAIGHPFIVAANRGFYRDLRNLGFRTFGHVIDESFDLVDNAQARMDRLIDVVADLCQQDLDGFLQECYNVCKYNQEYLVEFTARSRQEFPERFFQFLQNHE